MKPFDPLTADCAALARQFSLFTLVGAFGTLAHYVLLVVLVELSGTDAVIASMAGALLGATINYVLNYRFTFTSGTPHRVALPRFLAVASVGFLLNMALMWVAIEWADLHYILGQVITTSVVLLWTFFGNRHWTFMEGQNDGPR